VEESIRMTEDRDKWRKYVHGVANPRIEDGYRTEQRCGVVVSGVRHMNQVNQHLARLVLGWVTIFGLVYHLSM